jgi:hypothetical protein
MARPDGRIEKGQRLGTAISARAWNRAQEAADRVLKAAPGVEADGGGAYGAPYSKIKVVAIFNDQFPAWPRWSPVFLSPVLDGYSPTTNPTTSEQRTATTSFEAMPILWASGAEMANNTPDARMAGVLLEPLAALKIGWAAIGGVVQTKITNEAANVFGQQLPPYARLIRGDWQEPAKFVTDWFEGYRILWRENSTLNETGWALVNLSNYHCQQLVLLKTIANVSRSDAPQEARFVAHAFVGNGTYELPGFVTTVNELIYLGGNQFVWAMHPRASNVYGGAFRVVAVANLQQKFGASLGPLGAGSHVTLTSLPY